MSLQWSMKSRLVSLISLAIGRCTESLSRQTSQRLAKSKFNDVSIRIAHHREVTNDTAYIHRRLDQNVLLPSKLGNPIDFFPRITLKSEVIQTRLHFILDDDQNENGIFSWFGLLAEPNIVSAFNPPVAYDRETAKRSVELNGSVDVAAIDRDVRPAGWHCFTYRSEKKTRCQSYGNALDLLTDC